MSQINRQDIIADDVLEAPLILAKNLESAVSAAKDVIQTAKQYNDMLGTSSKTSSDHTQRTKELTDEQRVLAQITKQVATESAKQNDVYQFLLARKKELIQQTKDLQGVSAEEARTIVAKTSSIEKLSQALEKNRQAYAKLQNEHQRNSSEGKKLLSVIQEQDKALSELNPKLQTAHGNIFLISEALSKMGEGGVRVNEMLVHTAEVVSSSWGLLGAAISVVGFTLKQFFERTEDGRAIWENAINQMSIRWDIFRNHIGSSVPHDEAGAGDERVFQAKLNALQKQREEAVINFKRTGSQWDQVDIKLIDEKIDKLKKEYDINDSILALTLEKIKIDEREADTIEELETKRHEAIESELEFRDLDKSKQERLNAIVKANRLYNEINSVENEILSKRNGLLISEIYLRAEGRDLRADELLQIKKLRAAVLKANDDFLESTKKRTSQEAKLRKSMQKEGGPFINYTKSGVENLGADRAKLIQGLLSQYGITAHNDLNKLREDLGKKSLDDLKKIMEEAKNLRDIDAEKEKERVTELEHRKNEIIQAGANAAVKIVDDQFNHQIAAHEAYLNRTRENYQEEMQLASGNKIAQAQLTQQFRDKEKREQLEIVREKRKQAQFERDIAILSIINSTRVAVMKDIEKYGEFAAPFVAFDIAMGAIQEAAVLAKPLPSYDVGVDSHPGGPALVHPGELLTYHDQMAFTPSVPTIMDLPQGTQVDTSADTMRLLALAGLTYSIKSDRKEKEKVVEQLQAIREELKQTRSTREDFHAMMAGYYSFKKESEVFAKRIMVEKFGR